MMNACLLSAGWILVGTVVTDTRSVAILESDGSAQQVVREGDVLGDCVIGSIARDEIVLICPDDERRLLLQASVDESAVPVDEGKSDAQLFSLPGRPFRALLTDRQRLASQVSLEPAVAEGHVYGYRVASIAEDGDLAGFGIVPGDVITHVNGAPASDPGTFIQTIEALAGQTAFSLQLERDGISFQVDYVLVES
ncbi:MAG: hypothetical protein ACREVN_05560 [Gammaproteobacteria bacterium]